MNKTITMTAAGLLIAGVAFAAYKTGNFGPQYADVTSAKPITVKEKVYGDVVSVDPITQATSGTRLAGLTSFIRPPPGCGGAFSPTASAAPSESA